MNSETKEKKWKSHQRNFQRLTYWGLKHGYAMPYNNKLIEKLRTIYYGGIPASILLLSNGMSNGYCYDRALLMARAFIDTDDDVKLICAAVDSLKLNPEYDCDEDPLYADHCFVERTTKEGQQLIYDTSSGFIYNKRLYWIMEQPVIRKVIEKDEIIRKVKEDEDYIPEDIERDKYASPLILPLIESTYGRPTELYSQLGIELLQREIEHFKKVINYDAVCKEIEEDMRKKGFKN